MLLLAFDPGGTTGVCQFESHDGAHAVMTGLMQVDLEGLFSFLNSYGASPDVVVIEDFVLFRQKAKQQTGSRMAASQAIGAIKSFALQRGSKVVMQKPDIKRRALAISGIKMPGDHSKTHQWDAVLHAVHYLYDQGLYKSVLEKQMGV